MRLGTVMRDGRTQAFKQTAEGTFYLPAADIRALLSIDGWEGLAGERGGAPEPGDLAPPVTEPRAFVCAGLNYADHAREVGKTAPEFPTLFAKLSHTLIGAAQPIELPGPEVSAKVDWEAELVVVIGRRIRNASPAQAHAAILGYTAMNDVSMRDWQKRSEEWFQGKNFDRSTPVGPVIVTADEFDVSAGHSVSTTVNGVPKQSGNTAELLIRPADLVSYISGFMTLHPGDHIATGTPAGVGSGRTPQEFLSDGDRLVTSIEGIGELRNACLVSAERGRDSR